MNTVKLVTISDKEAFVKDIQKAFQEGYEAVNGICERTILPAEDIEESLQKIN